MGTEFAGVIEIDPPFSHREFACMRRLVDERPPESMPWTASRDGTMLRAQGPADLTAALDSLRDLLAGVRLPSRFRGKVAAYDAESRELLALSVGNGRVTVRSLRKCREDPIRSNVVDLAGRRVRSRAIG